MICFYHCFFVGILIPDSVLFAIFDHYVFLMKIKTIYSALFCIAWTLFACEKDDLCDGSENQTPRLHVVLLDQFNVETKKPAEYVKMYISGEENYIERYNTADLYLPLLPGTTSTEWVIEIYDVAGQEHFLIGTEQLRFTYTPENKYISKACGFKTNYNAFGYLRLDSQLPWIGGISLNTNSITNEENVHIQVYY